MSTEARYPFADVFALDVVARAAARHPFLYAEGCSLFPYRGAATLTIQPRQGHDVAGMLVASLRDPSFDTRDPWGGSQAIGRRFVLDSEGHCTLASAAMWLQAVRRETGRLARPNALEESLIHAPARCVLQGVERSELEAFDHALTDALTQRRLEQSEEMDRLRRTLAPYGQPHLHQQVDSAICDALHPLALGKQFALLDVVWDGMSAGCCVRADEGVRFDLYREAGDETVYAVPLGPNGPLGPVFWAPPLGILLLLATVEGRIYHALARDRAEGFDAGSLEHDERDFGELAAPLWHLMRTDPLEGLRLLTVHFDRSGWPGTETAALMSPPRIVAQPVAAMKRWLARRGRPGRDLSLELIERMAGGLLSTEHSHHMLRSSFGELDFTVHGDVALGAARHLNRDGNLIPFVQRAYTEADLVSIARAMARAEQLRRIGEVGPAWPLADLLRKEANDVLADIPAATRAAFAQIDPQESS